MDKQKPGRKSVASASVSVIHGSKPERPAAPGILTDRQKEIWDDTVKSEPVEWFNTNALQSMLADYCRHKEAVETVSEVVNLFQPDWLKNKDGATRYQSLLKMREAETRAAASLAGKLRLTNQSRYTPQAAGTATRNMAKEPKPWEM